MEPRNEFGIRSRGKAGSEPDDTAIGCGWFRRRGDLALRVLVVASLMAALLPLPVTTAEDEKDYWVGTWSTALHQPSLGPPALTNAGFTARTLRQIVHSSVGGDRVRVRFSTFGAGPVVIGSAHVALSAEGAAIVPDSDRTLTFGGEPSITVPAGAVVISDPVRLGVPARGNLAVSIFVPGTTAPAAWHFLALQTSYVSPDGDFTDSAVMPVSSSADAWFWLSGVEVTVSDRSGAIVAFGDSITDGAGSPANMNGRWPDHLAARLLAQPGNRETGVLNAAITGNRLLHDGLGPNGLARFDRDVLVQTGVAHVIVLLGNNDILFAFAPEEVVTADQIIAGHRQLIRRAHARGLKIYGATLTPFGGHDFDSPEKEAARQAVNHWIRTSREYDAVIDFDAALRDPLLPARLHPDYDAGDALHPNAAGYEKMAAAIPLELFRIHGSR